MVAVAPPGDRRMAGLYRRGNVYWGRAQRSGKEFRRSLGTSDRGVAERRFRDWLGDLDAIKWGERPRRSFEETAQRFIAEHLTSIKPMAAKRYGVSLKQLVRLFAGSTIEKIGSAELSAFETLRRTDGVTASSIRRDLACLSSMLTSAIDWEWIEANPVPSYLRRRARRGLKEGAPRVRYLSPVEETALLAHATAEPRNAMALAIDTGLRREELFSLTWSQIDLVRSIIRTTTRTKNGRARMVPLPPRARTILGTIPQRLGCPYVLRNPDTQTRYVQMNKGLKAARRRAGIAMLCWHDLRRTAGCRWLQRDGKTMAEVSILLGHSSVLVTEKSYAFLESETVAASLSGIGERRTKVGTGKAD